MRVAWVHPSWRDLVIEYLIADDTARLAFLQASSVHGVLLALSTQGGAKGTRRLPLVLGDRDWDILCDRVHALLPELETADAIGVIDTIAVVCRELASTAGAPEADALARTALARMAAGWDRVKPIPPAPLIAWLTLARMLSPRPALPPLAATWAELLPAHTPDLADPRALDRFTDWLALCHALSLFDPERLDELGVHPDPPPTVLTFIAAAAANPAVLEANPPVAYALELVDRLFPVFSMQSALLRRATVRARAAEGIHAPPPAYEAPAPRSGKLDVARVLRDL